MPKSRYATLMTDDAYNALALDVLDPDVWIEEALAGKVNNCLKRYGTEATELLIARNDPINVDRDLRVRDALVAGLIKTRLERDAESEANE